MFAWLVYAGQSLLWLLQSSRASCTERNRKSGKAFLQNTNPVFFKKPAIGIVWFIRDIKNHCLLIKAVEVFVPFVFISIGQYLDNCEHLKQNSRNIQKMWNLPYNYVGTHRIFSVAMGTNCGRLEHPGICTSLTFVRSDSSNRKYLAYKTCPYKSTVLRHAMSFN